MGAREFGRLAYQARTAKELSQDRVAFLVGELPGGAKNLNGKGVARIEEGRRRLDTFVVSRLIEVLGLDPAEAWHAAGLWPPDLRPEDLPPISELRAARVEAAQRAALEGAAASASPSTSDQALDHNGAWWVAAGSRPRARTRAA